MPRQRTLMVDGERVHIVACARTYMGNKCGFNVRVNGTRHFVNCLSFDEAMDKALARFLGSERSTDMAKQKKTAKATGRGKGARGAKKAAKATKATRTARKRDTAQQGAPQAKKPKKTSLMDAAVQILRETGQPMNTKAMIEAILAKGLWATTGKTPAATLYASILREIQKKGDQARFVKTERGTFALKS